MDTKLKTDLMASLTEDPTGRSADDILERFSDSGGSVDAAVATLKGMLTDDDANRFENKWLYELDGIC